MYWGPASHLFDGNRGTFSPEEKNLQFQSSIVDNGRDYVLHYVGMSNMHTFYLCCL
jgi:hypothetical protein